MSPRIMNHFKIAVYLIYLYNFVTRELLYDRRGRLVSSGGTRVYDARGQSTFDVGSEI